MPNKKTSSHKKLSELAVSTAKGGYNVTISMRVPQEKVWEALTDNDKLLKYFIDDVKGGFGPKPKATRWFWKNYGWVSLMPTVWQPHELLEFTWQGPRCDYQVTVSIKLFRKDGKTHVHISERGYKKADIHKAFDTCEGWSQVLCNLKACLTMKTDMRKK